MNSDKYDYNKIFSRISSIIRQETFTEKKQEYIEDCFRSFVSVERMVALLNDKNMLYHMIEVCVLAWNVVDQIKKRRTGILANREKVLEWTQHIVETCSVSNIPKIVERINYTVSLGRLNYLKRHSEFKTMRDFVRFAEMEIVDVNYNYEEIQQKVINCIDEITWFFKASDSIEPKLLISILLEQCPLCWIHDLSHNKLLELCKFLMLAWVKLKPPLETDIGEALFVLAESVSDDFTEQSKITGMVLDYVNSNNLINKIIVEKQIALDLLENALKMLRESLENGEYNEEDDYEDEE